MVSDRSWSECYKLGKERRRATEVERGGALQGGQQTKRAWNLRFLAHWSCQTQILHARVSVRFFFFLHLKIASVNCCGASLHTYLYMCEDVWSCIKTVFTVHTQSQITSSEWAKFLRPQRKSTVSFPIQAKDNGSFHWSMGGGGIGVQRKRDREWGRQNRLFTLASHCSRSSQYLKHWLAWTERKAELCGLQPSSRCSYCTSAKTVTNAKQVT